MSYSFLLAVRTNDCEKVILIKITNTSAISFPALGYSIESAQVLQSKNMVGVAVTISVNSNLPSSFKGASADHV